MSKSETPCADCGSVGFSTSYSGNTGKRMKERGCCFSCAFWGIKSEAKNETVIDGHTYSPGSRTSGSLRGMAGRRFDIEYFDGRRITTFDLWSGGTIPDRYRSKIPDTARFLNSAVRAQAGETTCWNPSNSKADPFPLPNQPPKYFDQDGEEIEGALTDTEEG